MKKPRAPINAAAMVMAGPGTQLRSLVFAVESLCGAWAVADPASEVNPFAGTRMSSARDYGKVNPGAVRPFDMSFWSPDPAEEEFCDAKLEARSVTTSVGDTVKRTRKR
jgi:putative alpha-1,2-mannosidase